MRLNIAICDDEQSELAYLSARVRAWGQARGHLCTVKTFSSAEGFLFEYSENKVFDLLLLDIEMPGENGLSLARRIRTENGRVQILFITGFPDYIAEGYEVEALHYLMKPVSEEKLASVLDRAAERLGRAEGQLTVSFGRQTEVVPFSEILYLEAQANYTVIHAKGGDYRIKASLSDTEAQLDGGFFRCQRSFIVNLSQVQRIKSDCVLLRSGVTVPTSRGMRERIGKAIISHF